MISENTTNMVNKASKGNFGMSYRSMGNELRYGSFPKGAKVIKIGCNYKDLNMYQPPCYNGTLDPIVVHN